MLRIDDITGAAAGPVREAQAILLQVHDFQPAWGKGWLMTQPNSGQISASLKYSSGLPLMCFVFDAEVDLLASRVLDGVSEGLAGVVPDPPLALHVVGVRAFPVGGARQRNTEEIAILSDEPHAARREVQVCPPHFLRSGMSLCVAPFLSR